MSTVAIQRSVQATSSDVALLQQTVEAFNLSLQAERFDIDSHLDQFIEKPWGYEYRVYADNFYDLWKLCLLPGRATSLHCHPRKETALLCLKGQAHVQLLEHGYIVSPGEFFLLGKGVFHATENIGETELHLIEVEIPRNKLDLVRAQDLYGRSGSSYEQKPLPSRIEPLQPCSRIPGARIRTTCLLSQYRFGVSSGAEIISSQQEQEDLLFFVPLRLMHAMKQTIRVFSEKTRVDENGVYLVISQTKRTEQGAQ